MTAHPTTDYAAELARIAADITTLEASAPPREPDPDRTRARRLAFKRYQRASLRGDFAALEEVDREIGALIAPVRPDPDLSYLKANLDFKFHRLGAVRRNLEACVELRTSAPGRALQADLDLQHGRYAEAGRAYREVIEQDPTWDNIARLAHLEFKLGDDEAADRHFEEAEDELTAKEMRHYAWLQLQRGLLDLSRGRHGAAREHYERAERAYSGYWVVAEHRAELLAACGECDAAAALYERVVAEVPRPELLQALGELYAHMGLPDQAEAWFDKALAAYMDSVARGEVHYLHHLADFYADVREDGAQAVRWAGEDLALRENPATLAAWAWALHRDGRADEALEPMRRSLASGAVDVHALDRASAIHRAAGNRAEGERLALQARARNPHGAGFHVHR